MSGTAPTPERVSISLEAMAGRRRSIPWVEDKLIARVHGAGGSNALYCVDVAMHLMDVCWLHHANGLEQRLVLVIVDGVLDVLVLGIEHMHRSRGSGGAHALDHDVGAQTQGV